MTAQNKKHKISSEYKKVGLGSKKTTRGNHSSPVVNKQGFRDIFGMLTKFVQVGGDFV